MGLTCGSRTWVPLCCIPYQQRDQRRMLPSLSCHSYNWSNYLLFCVLDTLIPGSSESGAGLQTNKYWGVVLTSSHGKEGQRDNTAWLTPWHAGLVSLAGKKSPYVSRHQLVAHLQRRSYSIYLSLEDSGVKPANKLLATTWNLQNTALFFSRFWDRG